MRGAFANQGFRSGSLSIGRRLDAGLHRKIGVNPTERGKSHKAGSDIPPVDRPLEWPERLTPEPMRVRATWQSSLTQSSSSYSRATIRGTAGAYPQLARQPNHEGHHPDRGKPLLVALDCLRQGGHHPVRCSVRLAGPAADTTCTPATGKRMSPFQVLFLPSSQIFSSSRHSALPYPATEVSSGMPATRPAHHRSQERSGLS